MKSGQRATRADAGGQRLPDAPKEKSPAKNAKNDASRSSKTNATTGGQPKAAGKK